MNIDRGPDLPGITDPLVVNSINFTHKHGPIPHWIKSSVAGTTCGVCNDDYNVFEISTISGDTIHLCDQCMEEANEYVNGNGR